MRSAKKARVCFVPLVLFFYFFSSSVVPLAERIKKEGGREGKKEERKEGSRQYVSLTGRSRRGTRHEETRVGREEKDR